MSRTFSGELYLVYCTFTALIEVILASVHCKHKFQGFTILRMHMIMTLNPWCKVLAALHVVVTVTVAGRNGWVHVSRYVSVLVAACISWVWFRHDPYIFHSKCQGTCTNFSAIPFKIVLIFRESVQKCIQFFAIFWKIRVIDI